MLQSSQLTDRRPECRADYWKITQLLPFDEIFSIYSIRQILQLVKRRSHNSLTLFAVWQYELWSFQTGDTKLERFLPKNKHTLLNFKNWCSGKLPKIVLILYPHLKTRQPVLPYLVTFLYKQ